MSANIEETTPAPTTPALDQKSIIQKYNTLQNECSTLIQKLTELQQDRNEHELVSETLQPLDPKRRAFRLIGGVLVERTVEEVLPSINDNLKNMDEVIKTLQTKLQEKNKEMMDWKMKYNIRTQEEVDAIRNQQMMNV